MARPYPLPSAPRKRHAATAPFDAPCRSFPRVGGSAPPPRVSCAKSAESLENKRVEFFCVQKSAQECEKKGLEYICELKMTDGEFRSVALGVNQNGNCWYTPPVVFVRVASKGVAGYGTWKSVRRMGVRFVSLLAGGNSGGRKDLEGVRRTAWRTSMGRRAQRIVPT